MTLQIIIGIALGAPTLLWGLIALGGAAPVMTLHKSRARPIEKNTARRLLRRVLSEVPELDGEWLKAEGFRPIGVFQVEGLMGTPKLIVWAKRTEPTWLCGYVLPEGRCQLDIVSKLSDDGALTTGTTKDGHLFPSRNGHYTQTFDVGSTEDLWDHHRQAIEFVGATYGVFVDQTVPKFADYFSESLREQGSEIRSMFLWPARIPWWYFTRRGSRHNRSVEQLYG